MEYGLYYQHHKIATIVQDSGDFLTCFGSYRLESLPNDDRLTHVRNYIEYSVRVWPLIEADEFDDNEEAMAQEEAFIDLIEGGDWLLVNSQTQESSPILIPVFCPNNEINWRWDALRR